MEKGLLNKAKKKFKKIKSGKESRSGKNTISISQLRLRTVR